MRTLLAISLVLAALPAAAADVCSAAPLRSELQYLRRLSLDLEGRVPTRAELETVLQTGRVEPAQLDGLLGKSQLKRIARDWLRAAIHGNLLVPLAQNFNLVRTTGADGLAASGDRLWIPNRALLYRPRAGGGDPMPCLDEPAQFWPDGRPRTRDAGDGYQREGWVEVHPYWEADRAATVKVCAFEAQAALHVGPADCSLNESSWNSGCGCGPGLRFCQGSTTGKPGTELIINRALVEQALRAGDRVIDEARPLSDVLTLRELEVNGPLSHYLRYQTGTTVDFSSRAAPSFTAPTKEFTDETWTRVPLVGRASGVLASPFFLLKFATNRGRANRFFDAFLCVALQAPPGGLPSPAEACSQNPDLTQRCGCSACHLALEPAAAHWGRFIEGGDHELSEAEFPSFDASCIDTGAPLPQRCLQYVTKARHPAEQPYVGKLRALLFASPQAEAAVASGPGAWAHVAISSKAFDRCVTGRMFERLVGRPLRDDLADERALRASLAQGFEASGRDLGALLRTLVTLPQYRRAGTATEPTLETTP